MRRLSFLSLQFMYVQVARGIHHGSQHLKDYLQIPLNEAYIYKTPLNEIRELNPSCSGGPYLDANGSMHESDSRFMFYYQTGEDDKIIFIFGGGGETQWCVLL